MKKASLIAAALVVGAGASHVEAQALRGSDTLFEVTNALLANASCNPGGVLTYTGGGSTTGEQALVNNQQEVAPMSRFFNAAACTATGNVGRCLDIGGDGLSVLRSQITGGLVCTGVGAAGETLTVTDRNSVAANVRAGVALGAAGLDCPGASSTLCTAGTYTFNSAVDALRVLYFGLLQDGTRSCNSDVRQSLIRDWGGLFQGTCAGENCTFLRRAFRRGGCSGTTDAFRSILGVPSSVAFCNENAPAVPANDCIAGQVPPGDSQDLDPVVNTCDPAGEDVCTRNVASTPAGTGAPGPKMGVVLPVVVPTLAATAPNPFGGSGALSGGQWANIGQCASGVFRRFTPNTLLATLLDNDPALEQGNPAVPRCPDGSPRGALGCLFPVTTAGTGVPGCIALPQPRTFTASPSVLDMRVFNLSLYRIATGTTVTVAPNPAASAEGANATEPLRYMYNNAFYRLNQVRRVDAASPTCLNNDSTSQIGCFSAAGRCSVGFAGREAEQLNANALALSVGGVLPTDANVQNSSYPLARRLYLCQADATVTEPAQSALRGCFNNPAVLNPVLANFGFVSGGPSYQTTRNCPP